MLAWSLIFMISLLAFRVLVGRALSKDYEADYTRKSSIFQDGPERRSRGVSTARFFKTLCSLSCLFNLEIGLVLFKGNEIFSARSDCIPEVGLVSRVEEIPDAGRDNPPFRSAFWLTREVLN